MPDREVRRRQRRAEMMAKADALWQSGQPRYTRHDAATLCLLSVTQFDRRVKAGDIPFVEVLGHKWFLREDLKVIVGKLLVEATRRDREMAEAEIAAGLYIPGDDRPAAAW